MKDNNIINDIKLNNIIHMQKRLKRLGIALIVIGAILILLCVGYMVFYAIKQHTDFRGGRAMPFIFLIVSIGISSTILSGGVYMLKTSYVFKNGKEKYEEMVKNIDNEENK